MDVFLNQLKYSLFTIEIFKYFSIWCCFESFVRFTMKDSEKKHHTERHTKQLRPHPSKWYVILASSVFVTIKMNVYFSQIFAIT